MAAMFQAQSANWEETQEKMSQLVSPICGSSCHSSSLVSNELRFFLILFLCRSPSGDAMLFCLVLSASIRTLVEAVRLVVGPRRGHTTSLIDRFLQVTSAIVAGRKVCLSLFISVLFRWNNLIVLSRPLDPGLSDEQ